MAKSISEVTLGTGELYIAAEATAFPTDPTTTPDFVSGHHAFSHASTLPQMSFSIFHPS